jgi:transcriptional regulator GlxA family with amidase domain
MHICQIEMTKRVSGGNPHGTKSHKHSRIIVLVVPPVDELDLVGPLQVFSSVNRLAGRTIYSIEVVTNAKALKVEGEGGVLTFLARNTSKSQGKFDSVLLVWLGLPNRD